MYRGNLFDFLQFDNAVFLSAFRCKGCFHICCPIQINIPIKCSIRCRCYQIYKLIDNIVADSATTKINKAVQSGTDTLYIQSFRIAFFLWNFIKCFLKFLDFFIDRTSHCLILVLGNLSISSHSNQVSQSAICLIQFRLYRYRIGSEIFKIGVPTLVFQLLTSISISLINNAAGNYGDSAIAGMGVVTRLISMGSLTVFGFIKGFQPIAGYSYGAKKFDRLRTAIKISILWSTIFCVIVGLLFSLFSTTIVSQFTTGNTEMIHIGASSLRVNGITFMLFGYYTVYSSLFLALGKGK